MRAAYSQAVPITSYPKQLSHDVVRQTFRHIVEKSVISIVKGVDWIYSEESFNLVHVDVVDRPHGGLWGPQ
jgi:hypothetical protein